MVKGVHAMFYTAQAEELRAFFRDKLGLPFSDAGGGWLIFSPAEGEVGCHPGGANKHEISFYCEDIASEVADLKSKGVEFTAPITDEGYGLSTRFLAPGGLELQLYQPKYAK